MKNRWYVFLTNKEGRRGSINYYGFKTKREAIVILEQAQKLVDEGEILKAEIVKE